MDKEKILEDLKNILEQLQILEERVRQLIEELSREEEIEEAPLIRRSTRGGILTEVERGIKERVYSDEVYPEKDYF